MPRELVFIRHGQSIGNTMTLDERVRSNIPNYAYMLTDLGMRQATALGAWLWQRYHSELLVSAVYTSPYTRAVQTAQLALPKYEFIQDALLRERETGIFGILTEADIARRYSHELRHVKKVGWYWYRPPSGESEPDMETRLRLFMRERIHVNGRLTLLFTHEQFTRIAWRFFTGATPEDSIQLWHDKAFPNASVTIFRPCGFDSAGNERWQCVMRGFVPPQVQACE